jgi:DNA-directed RNA polymerase specialized sigma24 family protein
MPDTKHITKPTPYATCADFRRIFDEDMNGLYQLSYLLTADREKAEQCFVSGLDDAVEGNQVFKEWARSWARRAIIQNAVRVINPQPAKGNGSSHSTAVDNAPNNAPNKALNDALNNGDLSAGQHLEMDAVLALEPFERFVYVLTVLERYSDQESSVLLGCARRDVIAARVRALQQLGAAMEMHYTQRPSSSAPSRGRRSSVLDLLIPPPLATST